MKINMTDKYETRNGKAVRVLCVDYKSKFPVLALITGKNDEEFVYEFDENGRYFPESPDESPNDLVLVPKRKIEYMPIKNNAYLYFDKEAAFAEGFGASVIQIIFENGTPKSVKICD